MITMAQRIEALRVEKGLSRPQLSAALGLPKSAMEKFETGRLRRTSRRSWRITLACPCSTFAERVMTVPGWSPGSAARWMSLPLRPARRLRLPGLYPAPPERMAPCFLHF